MEGTTWYAIDNIDEYDSPALVVYPARVMANIKAALALVDSPAVLRPHAKTSKMGEVAAMLMAEGVDKFKCATIAEADMLAMTGAKDVLLAYQPVGPKINRLLQLIKAYPATRFSCLVDNIDNAAHLNAVCAAQNSVVDVFIDLNIGMNRTGILPERAFGLFTAIRGLHSLRFAGLHAYDGHLRDADLEARVRKSDEAFAPVTALANMIQPIIHQLLTIIAGGTPTFPAHARRRRVECSPGTFVFSDWNYKQGFPDEPFDYAALVVTRVISIIDGHSVCLDLGHKSVAAENPLPRVHFLNMPEARPVAQSEEHLVVELDDTSGISIGDAWYGVPVHICPTVALYEKAWTVDNGRIAGHWNVVARNRFINF